MKAIQVARTGGPEVLELREISDPVPGPGQIQIDVERAGVNFIDTYHRLGLYKMPLPFVPGIEGAGTVSALGPDSEGFALGDRVVFCLGIGGYAERVVVDSWKVVHLPDQVSLDAGVAAMCQGMTAHYLTTDCFPLKQGDWALVHAAAGGVGLLLVQMAKAIGARVIGTVSTEEKAGLARSAGTDHVINYAEEDFLARVREITEGKGVSVVYESVGRATFMKSLDCLRLRGYLVLFGQSSGPVEPLDPQLLNQKGSLFLTRPSLFHYVGSGLEFGKRAGEVLRMIADGQIKVILGEAFPLAEAQEAHRRLEARKTVGKVLLIP